MKTPQQPPDSPALALMRHVWKHAQQATGPSWTRLNGALYQFVKVAIEAGLEFAEADIRTLASEFNGGYWFGADGLETWYAAAVEYRNASAWKALEAYLGRKPFLWGGQRVHVGLQFLWDGAQVRVTSFNDKEGYFVAVRHKHEQDERGYYVKTTVARRYKITHADLKAARASKRSPRPCTA